MITFLVSICLLLAGYFTYGRFVERYFGVSAERDTPVKRLADGVDYQELKPWRMYVIQFLNIAGLGPIFGAIMGAAYGDGLSVDCGGLHFYGRRARLFLGYAFAAQ